MSIDWLFYTNAQLFPFLGILGKSSSSCKILCAIGETIQKQTIMRPSQEGKQSWNQHSSIYVQCINGSIQHGRALRICNSAYIAAYIHFVTLSPSQYSCLFNFFFVHYIVPPYTLKCPRQNALEQNNKH